MSFEVIATKSRKAIEADMRYMISFYMDGKINLTTRCSGKLGVTQECYANFGVLKTNGLPQLFMFITEEQKKSVYLNRIDQRGVSWYLCGSDKQLVLSLAERLSWKFPEGPRSRIRYRIDREIVEHPFPGKKVFALVSIES